MKQAYIVYEIDLDQDCEEWQVFIGCFDNLEEAEKQINLRELGDSIPYEIYKTYTNLLCPKETLVKTINKRV